MLRNLFYIKSFREESDNTFSVTVRINPGHPVFSGHFPGLPVLPGVCSLYLIRFCTERFTRCPLQYVSIGSCKFTRMIDPLRQEEISVQVRILHREEGWQIRAVMQYGSLNVLKLQAIMKEVLI